MKRTALKPGKPLQRKTRLAPVSRKRAAVNRIRTKLLRPARLEPQICAVPWCSQIGDSPHEPMTRARGGSIVDPDNIVMVCWPHNQQMTLEPGWAYALGLLRHSWDPS